MIKLTELLGFTSFSPTYALGVQAQAARRLGISERSLWHRIKKLKIQVNKSFA